MSNNISLTVRLPHDLSVQLQAAAKEIGMTRTNLLRSAIHDFLAVDNNSLTFPFIPGKKDRIVLNVNQITKNIIDAACNKYSQPMNTVIIAVGVLALERSTKWLQSIGR